MFAGAPREHLLETNEFIRKFDVAIRVLDGIIPLWLAVVMHEGGTVIVGLNGLRLLKS